MPIPFLIAGAAAVLGAVAHSDAKETNERAQEIADDAKAQYDRGKQSLESAKKKTNDALLKLGNSKKEVLNGSITTFLQAQQRLSPVVFTDSAGLNEISKFNLAPQDVLQLQQMANIYDDSAVSAVGGAATGTVIALAASGSLPVLTSAFGTAGALLTMGEFGLAADLAGSALTFGLSTTPLAAIAAPVVLFTGISASIKADENLEKAKVMMAESDAAVEKMAVAVTMCNGISQKSEMFDSLLQELNKMFSVCVVILDAVTRKKFKDGSRINPNDLTKEELELCAVTGALAKAVKTVIDTPLLQQDGTISPNAQPVYEEMVRGLPALKEESNRVQGYRYNGIRKAQYRTSDCSTTGNSKSKGLLIGFCAAAVIALCVWTVFPRNSIGNAGTNTVISTNKANISPEIIAGNKPEEVIGNKTAPAVEATENVEVHSTDETKPVIETITSDSSDRGEAKEDILIEGKVDLPDNEVSEEPAHDIVDTPIASSVTDETNADTKNNFEPIALSKLVGVYISEVRGTQGGTVIYSVITESAGKFYFNFVCNNANYTHLESPVPLVAKDDMAVASYDCDSDGHGGIIQIKLKGGIPYLTASVNDKSIPQFDKYGEYLNALIVDDIDMELNNKIKNYPIFKDYLLEIDRPEGASALSNQAYCMVSDSRTEINFANANGNSIDFVISTSYSGGHEYQGTVSVQEKHREYIILSGEDSEGVSVTIQYYYEDYCVITTGDGLNAAFK